MICVFTVNHVTNVHVWASGSYDVVENETGIYNQLNVLHILLHHIMNTSKFVY